MLCRGLWWLCPLLALATPQAAACAAALSAAGYAVLAGGELPTVRTALMIGLVALARSGRRPLGLVQGLALAALALLLPAPLSVLSAGFWLSFGGVLWLVWCLPQGRPRGVVANLRGFLAAQGWPASLLPLGIALFGGTAWLGPLVNLPVIPWWTLLVVPLSLLGTALQVLHDGAGCWAWRSGVVVRNQLAGPGHWRRIHRRCGGWPRHRPGQCRRRCWACSGGCCHAVPGAGWLASCCACRCCGHCASGRPRGAGLLVHDVGQGTAVLLRTARHALWYDVGPPIGVRAVSGSWFRHCGRWGRHGPTAC